MHLTVPSRLIQIFFFLFEKKIIFKQPLFLEVDSSPTYLYLILYLLVLMSVLLSVLVVLILVLGKNKAYKNGRSLELHESSKN